MNNNSLKKFWETRVIRNRKTQWAVDAKEEQLLIAGVRALRPHTTPSDTLSQKVLQLARTAESRLARRRLVQSGVVLASSMTLVVGGVYGGPRLLDLYDRVRAPLHLRSLSTRIYSVPLHATVSRVAPDGTATVTDEIWTEGDKALLLTSDGLTARQGVRLFTAKPKEVPVEVARVTGKSQASSDILQRLTLPYLQQLLKAASLGVSPSTHHDGVSDSKSVTLSGPNGDQVLCFWDRQNDLPQAVEVQRKRNGVWSTYRRVTFKREDVFPPLWRVPAWVLRQTPGDGGPNPLDTYYVNSAPKVFQMRSSRLAIETVYLRPDGVAFVTYTQGSTQPTVELSLQIKGYNAPSMMARPLDTFSMNGDIMTYQGTAPAVYYNGNDKIVRAKFVPIGGGTKVKSTLLTSRTLTFLVRESGSGKTTNEQSQSWLATLSRQVGNSPSYIQDNSNVAGYPAQPGRLVTIYHWLPTTTGETPFDTLNITVKSIQMNAEGGVVLSTSDTVDDKDYQPDIQITGYKKATSKWYEGAPGAPGLGPGERTWKRYVSLVPINPFKSDRISKHPTHTIQFLFRDPTTKKRKTKSLTLKRVLVLGP